MLTMTILVTGDLHLNDNSRDSYRHKFMRTLRDIMRKHKPAGLIILGDICDDKDRHSAWLVNKVVDHIARCAAICPVIALKGNHDYVDIATPFFGFLARVPGVTWVDIPQTGETPSTLVQMGLSGALFLPHTRDYERDWAGLMEKGRIGTYSHIFAHNTFDGADAGHGRKLRGIPTTIFPKGSTVISGDIHSPQKLGPVIYAGAPYRVDFGDDYEPRLLFMDGKKITSMPAPGAQKRLVEFGVDKKRLTIIKPGGQQAGDILKVRVHIDNRSAMEQWAEHRAAIYEWGEKHEYAIHQVQPMLTEAARKQRAPNLPKVKDVVKSDDQIFGDYVKARDIDPATAKVGQALLRKA